MFEFQSSELMTAAPDSYEVDLPAFQGPLDLLLNLIEEEALDITKISLARVTDQYLAHLEDLKNTDPDELTDFLVIAAKLILIKSEVLLPRPPPILLEEEEEDVGDELARQLIIYKRFKQLAAHLRELEERGLRNFVRISPPQKVEPQLKTGEGSVLALLAAGREAMAIKPEDPDVDDVVAPEGVTIGQQMLHIWQILRVNRPVRFSNLLSTRPYRLEVVVTLLALLELIKRNIIEVEQPHYFGELFITKKETGEEMAAAEWEEIARLIEVS